MLDRRPFLLAMPAWALGGCSSSDPARKDPVPGEIDSLGKFELVPGHPHIVIGVPHGTADSGTLEAGRVMCGRLGAAGVFVTGFWDPKTRQRINVNRPSEQVIGTASEVVREWSSPRAIAANARYDDLVKQAAQGRVRVFIELHSNNRPMYVDSIEVSTLGISRDEAVRLRSAFEQARDRLADSVPRLAMHIEPIDHVTYPNYRYASTISKLSGKGCAIEHPGRVFGNRAWRVAYAECLAGAIRAASWA